MSDGGSTSARCDITFQDAKLGRSRWLQSLRGYVGGELAIEHLLGELLELFGKVAIFQDGIFEDESVEHLQFLVVVDGACSQCLVDAFQCGVGGFGGSVSVVGEDVINGGLHVCIGKFFAALAPLCPVAAHADVALPTADLLSHGSQWDVIDGAEVGHVFLNAVEVAHGVYSIGVGLQLILVDADAIDGRRVLFQHGDNGWRLFQDILDVGPLLLSVAS